MKKVFIATMFITLLLPGILNAGKYRAKGWYYVALTDGGAGLPPVVYERYAVLALGFGPPIGFGIGTAMGVEGAFNNHSRAGILFPIYLYWVPYMHINEKGYARPATYLFFEFSGWASSGWASEGDTYIRCGLELHYSVPWVGIGAEAGIIGYKEEYRESASTSPFIGVTASLLSLWRGWGIKEIPTPSIQPLASFSDADGNGILSGNEEGKIMVSIPNKGQGKAKGVSLTLSILEPEFKEKINYQKSLSISDIEPYRSKRINIPIKAKGELPKGKFTLKIDCSYTAETGEKGTETTVITINTAPSTGMIKVAFSNLSSEGLPEWIIPTPLEYADYQVKYIKGKVTILNLNTGERKTHKVPSIDRAKSYVKDFFLKWDREKPRIILSSSGGMVKAKNVRFAVRLSDDRKLDEMKVYLNDVLYKTESFIELTETTRKLELPLQMGDNSIKITLTDWVGKRDEKRIIFTRIRGGTGTYVAGTLPKGEPPPKLVVSAVPLDGNNTIVGGKEEGIRVMIKNRGKGTAKWVRVELQGDNTLLRYWGTERNLEDIKPGETKTATFSILMPTELPRRSAQIKVVVKEGRGYSPTVKPILNFSLVPAEVTTKQVEMVQDVDYDIPEGRISRKNGYALVIGLSKYSNAPPPKYSKNDAEIFSKYAKKVLGIPVSHIKSIYDDKATVGTIKANLTDWMKQKKGFKVIYFAGHGVPDPENPREGDVYLLPYDGDPELKSTLISLKDIAKMGANAGDTILLVLDACFSGSRGRTVQLASRPLSVAKIPRTNAITFAAAEGNQPSKEFEKAKHGYFTYYVLLGLKGKADYNQDGWITTTELYRFVKDRVADATNNVQIPVLRPKKDIRIGKVR